MTDDKPDAWNHLSGDRRPVHARVPGGLHRRRRANQGLNGLLGGPIRMQVPAYDVVVAISLEDVICL